MHGNGYEALHISLYHLVLAQAKNNVPFQVAAAVEEWKGKKERGELDEVEDEEDIYIKQPDMTDADRVELAMQEGRERRVKALVAIPTQKDIEDALLRRKKQELMQMYALDEFDEPDAKDEKRKKKGKAKAEMEMDTS